ncbi:MAG: TRAP transporter large permease [Planctomycetaceae bacterium]|jgi:C4-dicarboxylate transporter, DctM subunit|nr:TRAP transporter large permease [Planctomycetaceae bacterium]
MTPIEIGLVMLVAMLVLMLIGVHIGVVLALLSYGGIWWIKSNSVIATKMLALTASDTLANYLFGMVPMFVMMGLIVDRANIGRDTFDAANWLVGRVPGGVGVATVLANAIFAAITGISVASAALFTKVAVPQMTRLGYRPRFAVGAVAGSSVLGMLIPPSLLMILYGVITETSIGQLFRAGIGPGLLLALTFCIGIVLVGIFAPQRLLVSPQKKRVESSETGFTAGLKVLPSVVLIVVVLGGIYGGVFTVTEAAGAGAFIALVIAVSMKRLSFRDFWSVLLETGHISVTILFLILAASMYSKMLTFSTIPQELFGFVSDANLGLSGFLFACIMLLIALGMILDSASIILIVVPLIAPVAIGLDANMVWFGIVTILAVEIGLLTPPFGLSIYVVEATLKDKDISLTEIFRGAFPFVLVMMFVLLLVAIFPQISLFLV